MSDAVGELLRAAAKVETLLLRRGWRFCFIGGVAVQRWGNPRFTRDLDITLLTGFGNEAMFVDPLLTELVPRRDDAREFALKRRVLLARTPEGVDVDIALGALPFEERSIQRASPWQVREGIRLTTCCAEDLVAHKVFAGRDQDWADVEQVLIRQHARLDLSLVRSELEPLLELKEDTAAMGKLDQILLRIERRLEP